MRFRFTSATIVATLLAAAAGLMTLCPAAAADIAAASAPGPDGRATVAVDAHPLTPPDAPADQYFGRLKLSNLGVRNIIHALSIEGRSPLALPLERTRIMGVETALAQWGEEFPRDSWLRGAMLSFAGVMAGKHDPDTDRLAVDYYLQTAIRYPNTPWSRQALRQLASLEPATGVDWSICPYDPPDMAMIEAQRIRF
ncbi:MAG TPA: hypothetical protein VFO25_13100 [Candidatus Eremiobacteraceae bacterium]|nr:hypothetical protein [Candidatus Eremiobacteraceae bacterium]